MIILQYFTTKLLILNKYKRSNWKMQSPFSLIMRGIRSSGRENRKKKVKNHEEMSHVQMLAYFCKHMWDLFKYVIFHSASFCLIDYKHLWTSLCQLPRQEATNSLRGKWEQLVVDADLTVICHGRDSISFFSGEHGMSVFHTLLILIKEQGQVMRWAICHLAPPARAAEYGEALWRCHKL